MRLAALSMPFVLVACAGQPAPPTEPIASHELAAPVEASSASSEQAGESEELADESADEADEAPQVPLERRARIIKLENFGTATAVTVAAGTTDGVDKHWHACVLDAASGIKCLPDGELVVIRVDKQTLIAKTSLTPAQLTTNPVVQLKTP